MASYGNRVGERLRAIRLQKGLSLHDVEASSGKEFKASVLGAYERGERTISVPRLNRLSAFYQVPVETLLPAGETLPSMAPAASRGDEAGLCIDLVRLEATREPETEIISRYVRSIQNARGDFNGKMLTVRGDDVRTLAAVMDMAPSMLASRLEELGLRIPQRA